MKKLWPLILVGALLFGAEYGKITGRVRDAETGEALIGADVIVEGTELGAATDEKGEFVILYVPAGTYSVTASYLSYDPFTYAQVIVNADQTTTLNFRLKPTVIEVEKVTVVAERPPIVISQTQSGHSVTSQDISRLPVTTINQVVTLQAGVSTSNLGTHIRGGRNEEVTYYVDGIMTKVPHTGAQSTQINASAVEEVTVVSGGFDAEYGEALSGIINVVTKEGGSKPSGSFRYLTDEIFFMDNLKDKLNFGYNFYDLSLGGPVPAVQRLRYFLSGELTLTDAYRDALYKVPSPRNIYRAQTRLSYMMPNNKGKVTFSGFNSRDQYVTWSSGNLKYFQRKPMSRTKNYILSTTLNYMFGAQTLFSLKAGMTHYDRVYGTRDYEWEEENDQKWFNDYRMKAEHCIDYLVSDKYPNGEPAYPKDVIVDSILQYHTEYTNRDVQALRYNPYGVEGMYYTYGDYRVWRYWQNDDIQARFDISHAIGKIHEFKTGVDYVGYNLKYYDNNLPWVTNPFWDYYERTPYKVAAYIQDKMDFEGLIARLGLRFDYFDPKGFTYKEPNNPKNDTIVWAEKSYKFSPRLGFSLPVTERMKFRFNYGQYFQLPALDDMFGTTDTAVIRLALSRGNTIVGNIFMKPEKTVQYEVGIENQFTQDVVMGFTAYFKDVYDLSQIRQVIALPMPYFQFFNVDYGNIKGFEISIQKTMSNMWAMGLSYTLQFAKGTASYAGEFYYDFYYGGNDPITGLPLQPPVIDYWLDFDERNIVNANLDLALPEDFVFIPLQGFNSSFVFSFHSGHPYTPEDLKGNKTGDENSARMPGYWNVNLKANRPIKIGPAKLNLSALVNNLFNTKQVIEVYPTTGDPDNHGDPEPTITQFGYLTIASSRYSPQADYNHDGILTPPEQKKAYIAARTDYYLDPTNYNGPFRVQLGVSLGF
uniref:TonB-dependent receptor n=1 Tax=candidate division WOR-3 bacterium TaxID=2052148 RepID=A0A7V1EIN3_UNCW3